MPTRFPCACNSLIFAALSPGSTSASTMSMPISRAMRSAVARLSPVSMATCTPLAWSAVTAGAEVGRTASATATRPISRPARATCTTVRPCPCSRCEAASRPFMSTLSSAINLSLPSSTVSPPSSARAPMPSTLVNAPAGSSARPRARLRIASASGCSENFSTAAAVFSRSSSAMPAANANSTTSGCPRVSVPVLSKTTTFNRVASSSAEAFLNKMPFMAPSPVPTITAIGVARPSASGQAMTNTVMVSASASSSGCPRTTYQDTKVATPIRTAITTSHCDARSANNCAGALEFCASCTSLTICASAVSAPTLVAR
ncbi:hypothetical protein GALL_470890 [mine drainage metagenome]|uniref:Uncharacterized protein n=1 Tax=mine drainage metagenome TaxID=410659 RepID=A0A1J5PIH6_9ZZZZ